MLLDRELSNCRRTVELSFETAYFTLFHHDFLTIMTVAHIRATMGEKSAYVLSLVTVRRSYLFSDKQWYCI